MCCPEATILIKHICCVLGRGVLFVAEPIQTVTLAIILGTLLAIVYSIRVLVLLERRIARIDHHIELMAMSILRDEQAVLAEEKRIERMVSKKSSKKSSSKKKGKKKSKKKSSKKKSSKKKKKSSRGKKK